MYSSDDEDNDIYEQFGDESAREGAALNPLLSELENLEKSECPHKNIQNFPISGKACLDCGRELNECPHENTYKSSNGLHICSDCCMEMEILDYEPEWRFYGISDNRSYKDPSRCQKGKPLGKSIEKVFTDNKIKISPAMKAQITAKYNAVVGKKGVRGKGRTARVAACHFHVCQEFFQNRTSEFITDLYGLDQKDMSVGLNAYYEKFEDDRNKHMRSEDLLRWLMDLTGIEQSHYRRIVYIARYLEGTSKLLKRSSPQSVASAIIYFYLCLNPEYKKKLELTKTKFSKRAMLSDITVNKLVKEIVRVCKVKSIVTT